MRIQPRPGDEQWTNILGLPSLVFTTAQVRGLRAQIGRGWREDAACLSADPEAWFPTVGSKAGPTVLRICGQCPVRRSCLAHALVVQEEGIWAGTTPHDRGVLTDLIVTGSEINPVLDQALHQRDNDDPPGSEEAA